MAYMLEWTPSQTRSRRGSEDLLFWVVGLVEPVLGRHDGMDSLTDKERKWGLTVLGRGARGACPWQAWWTDGEIRGGKRGLAPPTCCGLVSFHCLTSWIRHVSSETKVTKQNLQFILFTQFVRICQHVVSFAQSCYTSHVRVNLTVDGNDVTKYDVKLDQQSIYLEMHCN